MENLKNILIIFCIFGYGIASQAQEAVSAAGGNASGSGGTASYTIGQVVYTTISGASGTITQGVQQPYEILVNSGIEEAKGISLECIVYPNPTNDLIKLKIENYKLENLSYQVYDINGKLLQNKKTEGSETIISMSDFVPATYFLKVTDNKKEIKVFKIIKN